MNRSCAVDSHLPYTTNTNHGCAQVSPQQLSNHARACQTTYLCQTFGRANVSGQVSVTYLCAEDSMGCTACMLSSALFQTCVAWHRETVYKRCCVLPRARKRFIIITASEYYTAEARRVLQLRNAYFHSLLVDVHESDRELLIEIE